MTTDDRRRLIQAWLLQTQADLTAAQLSGPCECHRRYWYQQAFEKGIKTLGLILWDSDPHDREFRADFLRSHSPISRIGEIILPAKRAPLGKGPSKRLWAFARELSNEFEHLPLDGPDIDTLRQIDATTPSLDPSMVSYRYPFMDVQSSQSVAPASYDGWTAYQGSETRVKASVIRFVKIVETRVRKERPNLL